MTRNLSPVIIASISFFQKTDDELKQLFRAEWDCYPEIEGYNHPQPHWHFTAHLSDKTSFSDLDDVEEELETANTRDMLDFLKEIVDLLNRIYLKIKE